MPYKRTASKTTDKTEQPKVAESKSVDEIVGKPKPEEASKETVGETTPPKETASTRSSGFDRPAIRMFAAADRVKRTRGRETFRPCPPHRPRYEWPEKSLESSGSRPDKAAFPDVGEKKPGDP